MAATNGNVKVFDMNYKDDIKKNQAGGEIIDSQSAFSEQDKAIHEILMKLLQKWRAASAPEQKRTSTAIQEAKDEEFTETMMISSGGLKKGTPPVPKKEQVKDLDETMIISPTGMKKDVFKITTRAQPEELEKTVSLRHRDIARLPQKGTEKSPEPDFLTETVILRSGKKKEG